MTVTVDDAGSGDLLWGTVIGAYREDDDHFLYDLIPVKFFQDPLYAEGASRGEAARIAVSLVKRFQLKPGEKIKVCQGDILNEASAKLIEEYGEDRIERVHVEGRAQHLVELAYLDEIRNLGYEPIEDRTERWGKSFRHMYDWVKADPASRVKLVKSGFPNVKKYSLFSGEPRKRRR